jgi:hypothetical protein
MFVQLVFEVLNEKSIKLTCRTVNDVTDSISRLRTSEFVDPWAIRDFADAFGLDESKVVTFDFKDYKLGITYKKIATTATIANNNLDKDAVKGWVQNYGSKVWSASNTGVKGYTPAANSHYDVLDTWRGAAKEIEKGTAKCLFNPWT